MPSSGRPIDYTVPCPACQAQPDEWCSAPADTGRRDVRWVHYAREQLADRSTVTS